MTEQLPPTEGQMTPLYSDQLIGEIVTANALGFSARYELRAMRDAYENNRAALQQQLADANSDLQWVRNQRDTALAWAKQVVALEAEVGRLALVEVDNQRLVAQLASQDAELTEKQKYVLQLERAVTEKDAEVAELKQELMGYIGYAIDKIEYGSNLKHEFGRQRYRELAGRNYGESEGDNANP